ncbi:hypothetical protein FB460_2498 [Propioniferax innocua]|uniref:DUF4352 domain-containing protein n=2 Tax=Propioniferax innocua TaxID=1753 RepID=A0A542Z8G9_9ACTN|nr:hypothetical protein FB460_2498 [Propioniferax innocua]
MIRKIAAITAAAGGLLAAGLTTTPAHADTIHTDMSSPKVEMEKFDVTLLDVRPSEYNGTFIEVLVCANDVPPGEKMRVSWDPWNVSSDEAIFSPSSTEGPSGPTYPWAYVDAQQIPPDSYGERYLVDGECAEGTLLFHTDGAEPTAVFYENAFGERAIWRLDS